MGFRNPFLKNNSLTKGFKAEWTLGLSLGFGESFVFTVKSSTVKFSRAAICQIIGGITLRNFIYSLDLIQVQLCDNEIKALSK